MRSPKNAISELAKMMKKTGMCGLSTDRLFQPCWLKWSHT